MRVKTQEYILLDNRIYSNRRKDSDIPSRALHPASTLGGSICPPLSRQSSHALKNPANQRKPLAREKNKSLKREPKKLRTRQPTPAWGRTGQRDTQSGRRDENSEATVSTGRKPVLGMLGAGGAGVGLSAENVGCCLGRPHAIGEEEEGGMVSAAASVVSLRMAG